MSFKIFLISFSSILSASLFPMAGMAQSVFELDQVRGQQIVNAFNAQPEKLIEPLDLSDVKIKNGVGRVDVNKKAKFSYYIQTENPQDPQSRVILIPMATSRFTPTYYQTDEWWDAHKDQKPMPRQPMEEVATWLKEMKLDSNPDVLVLKDGQAERLPLQKYLLDHYIQTYSKNGMITVYRGAEREGEVEVWNSGQRPKSVRYWTPTANYAWRYARKNLNFVEELVAGKTPLIRFDIPVEDFKEMVMRRWPRLTLGTELTKKAHDSFDRQGIFKDHLAGGADFLGEGHYGVEFEIRSNKSGADQMARYYKGAVGIAELARDRISVIQKATERSIKQRPEEAGSLTQLMKERVSNIQAEAELLLLLIQKGSQEQVRQALQKVKNPEITNIDGFSLGTFVEKKLSQGGYENPVDVFRTLLLERVFVVQCQAVHQ